MSPQSRLVAGIVLIMVADVSFWSRLTGSGPKELSVTTQLKE